jgi:D-3-phosphoglycerate dehydrogenase / 2-oxoglutarate reductase
MKIYILDAFHPAGPEYAAQHFDVVRWDDPKVKAWHEEADGVMVRMTPIRAADLARARKVKVICKQGVGFDTIDIQAASKHGIPVLRTPGVNSEAVAEMALALSLSATRRVTECDKLLRAGAKIDRTRILGPEMWRKTVGVIGMGNIGSRVARKWRGAFEAEVLYYDPYVSSGEYRKVASLEELLKKADLVSIHVPLTDETRNMIAAPQLALMKKTAVLVNTSRGGIIDEAALYEALKSGRLFAAGLDVWEVEPPPKDAPLLSLPNVVGTPHAAGGTFDTQERSSLQVAMQVVEVLQGKPPQNRVN